MHTLYSTLKGPCITPRKFIESITSVTSVKGKFASCRFWRCQQMCVKAISLVYHTGFLLCF